MASSTVIPAGDFRTSYAADTTIFPTRTSRNFAIAGVVLLCFAPQLFSGYWLAISIQIGIFAIAALGLNILVGFTGQISIGHAAFFLFGAFISTTTSQFPSSSPSRLPVSSPRWSGSCSACPRHG
jgi:branched-chain amino acid transport system permease protein